MKTSTRGRKFHVEKPTILGMARRITRPKCRETSLIILKNHPKHIQGAVSSASDWVLVSEFNQPTDNP